MRWTLIDWSWAPAALAQSLRKKANGMLPAPPRPRGSLHDDGGPDSLADAGSEAPTCDAASPDLSKYDGGQFLDCLEYLRNNDPSQVAACEAECGCAGFLETCLGSVPPGQTPSNCL